MGNNNSPLESLAAFAIAFAAGAISVAAMGIYDNWVKSKIIGKMINSIFNNFVLSGFSPETLTSYITGMSSFMSDQKTTSRRPHPPLRERQPMVLELLERFLP